MKENSHCHCICTCMFAAYIYIHIPIHTVHIFSFLDCFLKTLDTGSGNVTEASTLSSLAHSRSLNISDTSHGKHAKASLPYGFPAIQAIRFTFALMIYGPSFKRLSAPGESYRSRTFRFLHKPDFWTNSNSPPLVCSQMCQVILQSAWETAFKVVSQILTLS